MPTMQSHEPCLYRRLKMVSQMKIARHAAPAAPPTWVSEKKTKKPAPNARQTHGCAAGRTRRNRIAAGTRNRMKYANVLKIIPAALRGKSWKFWRRRQWGEGLLLRRGKTYDWSESSGSACCSTRIRAEPQLCAPTHYAPP